MRILFFGDIIGRSGRDALQQYLPFLKEKLSPDTIIVNGDNSAAGHGLTLKIAQEYFDWGIDCVTTGNHVWAQKDMLVHIDREPRILRALNYPEGTPGKGYYRHTLPDGRSVLFVHALGNSFMSVQLDCPFKTVRNFLNTHRLGQNQQAIFIDFHAESTAEKMAMAHYLDGEISALIGSHTHMPTADEQILPKGTAFQTDVGMCGDFNSVIGSKVEQSLFRFLKKLPNGRLQPAEGEATLCATIVETNDKTGKATAIDTIRIGGRLKERI